MKKVLFTALLASLSLGCAITDYPVIFDTRGADDNGVLQGQYDHAYIIPSGQVATLWADGSEELFTVVSQDWKGDQTLKTYNNFDPTATVSFLDQTYCDPTKEGCALATSDNPDNASDAPFDYVGDASCSGFRSLSVLVGYSSRIGECGSGIWADKQGAAYEFSILDKVNFRGQSVYHLPIDSSAASFNVTGQDGAVTEMPVFGRFNLYIDEQLRTAVPVSGNFRYQLNWLDRWVDNHGSNMNVDLSYGSLSANFKLNITTVDGVLDRF